jgi:hypothetical protein
LAINGAVNAMRRWGESSQHEKQKERIGKILEAKGWRVSIDSQPFTCNTDKGERTYWPDVYAQNYELMGLARGDATMEKKAASENGARRIIVEVQGPKGHNTKLAHGSDTQRYADIKAQYGEIEYFEVYLKSKKSPNDIRNWTEQDICEELRL